MKAGDNQSEIARLRQQLAAECNAGWQALYGLASGVARHEVITARFRSMERTLQQLSELVGEDQATEALYEIYTTVTDVQSPKKDEQQP
jgi:hypothetical protein